MNFYDYDCRIDGKQERYSLRGPGVVVTNGYTPRTGRYCVVYRQDGPLPWVRVTQQYSKHGRRYVPFSDLGDALTSGITWARRRKRGEG